MIMNPRSKGVRERVLGVGVYSIARPRTSKTTDRALSAVLGSVSTKVVVDAPPGAKPTPAKVNKKADTPEKSVGVRLNKAVERNGIVDKRPVIEEDSGSKMTLERALRIIADGQNTKGIEVMDVGEALNVGKESDDKAVSGACRLLAKAFATGLINPDVGSLAAGVLNHLETNKRTSDESN